MPSAPPTTDRPAPCSSSMALRSVAVRSAPGARSTLMINCSSLAGPVEITVSAVPAVENNRCAAFVPAAENRSPVAGSRPSCSARRRMDTVNERSSGSLLTRDRLRGATVVRGCCGFNVRCAPWEWHTYSCSSTSKFRTGKHPLRALENRLSRANLTAGLRLSSSGHHWYSGSTVARHAPEFPSMRPLVSLALDRDEDVVAARRSAAHIGALLEFDVQERTRIATAVSEIVRNAFRYATGGGVQFELDLDARPQQLRVVVEDRGPGIANLDAVLGGTFQSPTGMGLGIAGARRLMDGLSIDTTPAGTRIVLSKSLPPAAGLVSSRRADDIAAAASAAARSWSARRTPAAEPRTARGACRRRAEAAGARSASIASSKTRIAAWLRSMPNWTSARTTCAGRTISSRGFSRT